MQTVNDLKKQCKALGLKRYSHLLKAPLIEFINEALCPRNKMREIISANRLNKDTWSVILSFIESQKRIHSIAHTNKEIYSSLQASFMGQIVKLDLKFPRLFTTDAKLTHLTNMFARYATKLGAAEVVMKEIKLMGWHNNISDAGLAHLANVKVIHLENCENITDAGLAHLKNVKSIELKGSQWLTDAGLAHLSNVEEIGLHSCDGITDTGLAHLKNVKKIKLRWCRNITDAGLAHLKNVEYIDLNYCRLLTNAGLAHLKNVKVFSLSYCPKFTNAGLKHLVNVEKIELRECQGVTDAGIKFLKDKGVKVKVRD